MSDESETLRAQIRAGAICPQIDRARWEWAVARIYEIERAEGMQ